MLARLYEEIGETERKCRNVKWCHTGCEFGAKNTVLMNYLGAAERLGVGRTHLSLSHDAGIATAFVVLEDGA